MSWFRETLRGLLSAGAILVTAGLSTGHAVEFDKSHSADSSRIELASPQERIHPKGFYFYNSAIVAEAVGDLNTAADSYRRALSYFQDSYEVRYSYARILYVARRYADAIEGLRGIVPEDGPVRQLRAAAYRSLGLVSEAHDEYLKLLEFDSSLASVYSFLAVQYQQMGQLDSAAWAVRNLTRLDAADFQLWVELGKIELDRGRLAAARTAFDSSLALNNTRANMMAFIHLGDVFRLLEQPDSALSMFRAAHEVDPGNIVLNRLLSTHYIAVDSFEVALPYARRLLEEAPDDLAGAKRLGLIYYVLDSLDYAQAIFDRLVLEDPTDIRNHYYLGRIAAARQDYRTAREQFEAVVAADDTLAEGYIDLGYIHRMLKEPEREIDLLREGLEKVTDSTGRIRLLMALGSAQEQGGKIAQATATFEQLLQLSPDHAPALNYLGYMLADQNQRLEYAETLIKKAVDMDPDNAAYLDSYGWVRYRQGKYKEALIYLRRAAELDNDPTILDHLGDAFHQTGDPDSARQYWQKALKKDPENKAIKEKLSD